MGKLQRCWSPHQQERSPSALLDILTFCFPTDLLKARKQLEEAIFNEWEKLQLNVRELGQALETVSNPFLKCDMESDLVVIINKKNQLASILNFN